MRIFGKIWRGLKTVFLYTVMTLVFVEIGLQVVVRMGLLDMSLPTYKASNARGYVAEVDPDYGIFHLAGVERDHLTSCFRVINRTNSFGMRDRETTLESDGSRVVVLGDSFAEGFGVMLEDTFHDRLERMTSREHLSFGSSGGVGPTQYWKIYEKLGSRFDHDAVIVMILPNNDFWDDTPHSVRLSSVAPWRPFLVGEYPDYTVTYPNKEFEPSKVGTLTFLTTLAKQNILSFRTLDHYWLMLRARLVTGMFGVDEGDDLTESSPYFNYTSAEFDRMRYALERIVEIASPRPVVIATIPRHLDFEVAMTKTNLPLVNALEDLASGLGAEYIDLTRPMLAAGGGTYEQFFHECDGHWSPAGHAAAAEILAGTSIYRP
ncbi:SGNH/GDSL hydrolase family protein [Aliiroseovarius subalbicans]|uniref:SGNH/GDSL hydrolase family protein n=1 Tax=Aliiroseovarius subalbicans TaxID=2925840 RepID=UPI001F565966|nr:SGNH/GDSL hydrolase family protein [Aliiroseovarius subalbicans]MCI2397770.1 SGNH/GDSL hydrolase family protein [Aliiroseovarius subalbicans]